MVLTERIIEAAEEDLHGLKGDLNHSSFGQPLHIPTPPATPPHPKYLTPLFFIVASRPFLSLS